MADNNVGQSSAQEEVPMVSLIHGRSKRSTAGRHMSALLNAEADDDLALLFEEVDDDNEFSVGAEEEGGEDDDMGLDSSSDDEDQGPNARSDDYDGEIQLQKEEKADKKKRREQQDLRFKIARKKVKIDPTAVSAVPAPRPKKKSERISWIPTPEEGPTRSSSRRQTMQNKELTHARLKDSEEKRIRLIATMEEAAKRKAHLKPKEITQAERLAEAERVERHNSKSLNRWEEMEKRKAEERKAKIEALQNRRLEGPVMSYWSGIATWADGRLTRLGKVDITPKPEKEENARKKSKRPDKEAKAVTEQKPVDNSTPGPATTRSTPPTTFKSPAEPVVPGSEDSLKQNQETVQMEKTDTVLMQENDANLENTTNTAKGTSPTSASPLVQPPKPVSDDTQGVEKTLAAESQKERTEQPEKPVDDKPIENASKDEQDSEKCVNDAKPKETPKEPALGPQDVQMSDDAYIPKPEEQGQANGTPTPPEENTVAISKELITESTTAQPSSASATAPQVDSPSLPATTATAADAPHVPAPPSQQGETSAAVQQEQAVAEVQQDQAATTSEEPLQPEARQHPPVIEHTGRTLTVLENFDDKTAQSREFSIYFNGKKPPRLTKISSSLCVITSLPSRYRDPETSLPFANSYAYNEIRNTVAQKYAWSSMLGCYVGLNGVAAQGVPARFLDPQAPPPETVSEKKDRKCGNEPADGGKDKVGETDASECTPKASNPAAATPTPAPMTAAEAGPGDPMEIDKP
ncbi:YL1 nuclear protein-domain-containing protein [Aspergillus alliaceus]|uniref:YL1 nuclear protein-domain-containing protein n=1 Tax=Petromyces alliaceus TaxID=209559 RepID=A0A5N7BRN8_PETAA|nr:YL1 nuclear protein-domain-containing protein [Aspergillus alliaceus]